MQEFALGQRWISTGELQLGLGMVIEVDFRTVAIIFPATGETRVYAKQSAPLTRVQFDRGDVIQDHDDNEYQVVEVVQKDDLLSYRSRDASGQEVLISEGKLNSFIHLNQPVQRLLSGQIDRNHWFELRAQAQKTQNLLDQSHLQGLAGCRTSLIDHQLYIAHEVSQRYSPRVLLADEVGLGKTIEAGLILHQQYLAEKARRVLIVVPESLVHQWLVEMMRRFNLLFSIFDENRCQAIEGVKDGDVIGAEIRENPFQTEQLVLCSLEFLVANPLRFRQSLEGDWDMLIVDEAHHLVWEADNPSIEYQCIEQLARLIPSVLLLTATPEQLGKESHFARLRLLDPDRFSDIEHFIEEESHYREIADIVEALHADSSPNDQQLALLDDTVSEGDNAFQLEHLHDTDPQVAADARDSLIEHLLDRHGTGRLMFRNTRHVVQGFPERRLQRYALDYPGPYQQSCSAYAETGISLTQPLLSPELAFGLQPGSVGWGAFDPRVDWLLDFLKQHRKDKVLVICSAKSTVLELVALARNRSGMNVAAFHENLTLVERDRAAAWFADREAGTPALICSEIGSEGRNFQFAHHLVMFDLPDNPDLLEQRIGRLDRIGQTEVIEIHVPYLEASAQQVMLDWLDQGLDAFNRICPAGHTVYRQMHQEINKALRNPDADHAEFIGDTRARVSSINEQLQKGRDRLLEMNSCRPEKAAQIRNQVESLYSQLDLVSFMELLYDFYGINFEIHCPGCWVLQPTDNMQSRIPGLPDEGLTITYERDVALTHEDVQYLTWEHPLVLTLIDMLLGSEQGNTALIAIKYPGVKPGSLLLDCFFRVDVSGEPRLRAGSYLEDDLIRVCLDEHGQQHQQQLAPRAIARSLQVVDSETADKVVRSRLDLIKKLFADAQVVAEQELPEKQHQAMMSAEHLLGQEAERLVALQTLNPNVRDDEIEFFRDQLTQVTGHIEQAQVRLDAVRVMVAI